MGAVLGMALGIDMVKSKKRSQASSQKCCDQLNLVAGVRTLPRLLTAGQKNFRLSPPEFRGLAFLQAPKPRMGGGGVLLGSRSLLPLISSDRAFEVVFLAGSCVV